MIELIYTNNIFYYFSILYITQVFFPIQVLRLFQGIPLRS